jgi:hypothetical protein
MLKDSLIDCNKFFDVGIPQSIAETKPLNSFFITKYVACHRDGERDAGLNPQLMDIIRIGSVSLATNFLILNMPE